MALFEGSGVAIITPFDENGVNLAEYKRMIEWQIAEGTDAIIACGTTGEPSTMSTKEKESVIDCAVQTAAGRVPVIAGTGGNCTNNTLNASKRAKELGADGLLIVTPYYNKCTQGGLVRHYELVADTVDLPIIIYNVPGRTGLNMTPETLYKLSQHKNIAGMKEASANITQITEMARLIGDNVTLYSGNDDHIVALLALGGKGVISVVANVAPKLTHQLVATYLAGDHKASLDIQFKLNPLVQALFTEVNPIPVKAGMNLLGFNAGIPRLPLTELTEGNLAKLRQEMAALSLIA